MGTKEAACVHTLTSVRKKKATQKSFLKKVIGITNK